MSDNDMETVEEEPMEEASTAEPKEGKDSKEVYLPGKPLAEGEELVCDRSAYVMLHQAQTGAPCLSFDVIRDGLGEKRYILLQLLRKQCSSILQLLKRRKKGFSRLKGDKGKFHCYKKGSKIS